jgi:hypothetical protein
MLASVLTDKPPQQQQDKKMPLLPGKKNIGHNIKAEESVGKPKKQAIAIALSKARESGVKIAKKKGKK